MINFTKQEDVSTRSRRSDEELGMRKLICPMLRKAYPGSRIIHELPLRYSSNRIDMAAVTNDSIISVEIKSSKDVIDRLEYQVRAFLPICTKVIVALAPKWNKKLPDTEIVKPGSKTLISNLTETQSILKRIGGHIETWTVCHETSLIDITDGGWLTSLTPWSSRMLDMLWRKELEEIADVHRVSIPKRASHAVIRDSCEAMMSGSEVRKAVCSALRRRSAFDKASDPPMLA